MLSRRQLRAVKRLFQKSEEEVAAEIGVKAETIVIWLQSLEFRKALIAEGRTIRAAAARITTDVSLSAAKNLQKQLSDAKDGKLALDILKASGAFEEQKEDEEDPLESILQEVDDVDESQS